MNNPLPNLTNHPRPRIDPAVFRELEIWVTRVLLDELRIAGHDGIVASDTIYQDIIRSRQCPEWSILTPDQRAKMCWRQIRSLVDQRVIEGFRSTKRGHDRSRIRYREANVLDRIAAAL
jgi:hypothetical protein